MAGRRDTREKAREKTGEQAGTPAGEAPERAVTYCIVPRDLAPKLHDALRRHFRDDPRVEVIVEQRVGERRSGADRRVAAAASRKTATHKAAPRKTKPRRAERRRVRSVAGRRVGERRAAQAAVAAPPLPRKAKPHAGRLAFVERVEPGGEQLEDRDTARLVMRIQAGDREGLTELYQRYFDRVFAYFKVVLNDRDEAEDATQEVFTRIIESIDSYELRPRQPFRAWLFVIVRNLAVTRLQKLHRLEVVDPHELNARLEQEGEGGLTSLDWITDPELLMFIERLQLPQRQVLLLRYMLDLSDRQISAVLGRPRSEVRVLQYRALTYLRKRLKSIGRTSIKDRPGQQDHPGQKDQKDRPAQWRRPVREAPVLRQRRFALSP